MRLRHEPGLQVACAVLMLVVGVSLAANWLAPAGYAKQYREATDAPPSRAHWLGTDEIGRDRFARVLYGTRISLLLAPAAALLSTLMAALIGGLAGYLGGAWARIAMAVTDLFLSLPWLFLLITVRALMPLNVSPLVSVLVTFLMLGFWVGQARRGCCARLQGCCAIRILCGRRGHREFAERGCFGFMCSEFEASAVCAVLDFDSGLHSERGQSRDPRAGRGRADAVVGKSAEGIGRSGFRWAKSHGSSCR